MDYLINTDIMKNIKYLWRLLFSRNISLAEKVNRDTCERKADYIAFLKKQGWTLSSNNNGGIIGLITKSRQS